MELAARAKRKVRVLCSGSRHSGPRLVLSLLLSLLVFFAETAAAQNLLANGGAEAGDLSGWSTGSPELGVVTSQTQQAGIVYPDTGVFLFTSAAQPGTTASFRQDGISALVEGSLLNLSGRVSTEQNTDNDFGIATVRALDAEGAVLTESSTVALTTPSNSWLDFSVSLVVPAGAVRWEVELIGSRVWGSFINVFYDTLVLQSESAPPAVPGLGLLGGLGLTLILFSLGQRALRVRRLHG
jgi:hypothetical protein